MNHALIWMPTLDMRNASDPFRKWAVERFLRSHGGIGHIVASSNAALVWPSIEVSDPAPTIHWYCTAARKVPKKARPLTVNVEMPVPSGALDPVLQILESAKDAGRIRRLVLRRPPRTSLARLKLSIDTLADTITPDIWLDAASFGWNAVSYLIAANDRLQISGVPDHDLWRLAQLAHWLNRPLVMQDLSTHPPVLVPRSWEWAGDNTVIKVLKTLPEWESSR